MANDAGIYQQSMSVLRFNKVIGYAFEQAFIDARFSFYRNYKTINGVKPDVLYSGAYTPQDATRNLIEWLKQAVWPSVQLLPNANAYKIKATKGDIKLSRQIKGEIDLVASSKSKEGTYATNVAVATLTLVTFSDVKVDDRVVEYAKSKNINLMQITGQLNPETGDVTFSSPVILNQATPTYSGVINIGPQLSQIWAGKTTSEVGVDFSKAATYANAPDGGTNESGNEQDCDYDNNSCNGP